MKRKARRAEKPLKWIAQSAAIFRAIKRKEPEAVGKKKKARKDLLIARRTTTTPTPTSLERQKIWFDALGSFEQITPYEAAEIWGVSLPLAMQRLHLMLGSFVKIPEGSVEIYVKDVYRYKGDPL